MATSLNDNIRIEAGKNVDDRYLNGVTPWTDVAAVNTAIVPSRRHKGLTVLIDDTEYWYRDGISNIDLIVKAGGGGSAILPWVAGTYTETVTLVTNDIDGCSQIFSLSDPTRPFVSADFFAEWIAGKWELISERGYMPLAKTSHGWPVNTVLTFKGGVWDKFTDGDLPLAVVRLVIDTSHVLLAILGNVNNNVTATLTPGDVYYAQSDGSLSTLPSLVPVFVATDLHQVIVLAGGGGGGGGGESNDVAISAHGIWEYENVITSPVADAKVRFNNNTVIASITEMYIAQLSEESTDAGYLFGTLLPGDVVFVQERGNATKWVRFVISASLVDNGTWWTIPVTVLETGGTLPSNDAKCVVRFTETTGGGESSFLTEYFTGNGAQTVFVIPTAEEIQIVAVYVGGQRLKEGTHYSKDDVAKTVTITPEIATGIGIDVEYFSGATNITSLVPWSESGLGVARIATQAETEIGTDDIKGITPLKLASLGTLVRKVASVTGGIMDLNLNDCREGKFENTTIQTTPFAITFSNHSKAEIFTCSIRVTGSVAITLPSSVVVEEDNARWVNGTKIFTVVGGTGSYFVLSFLRISSTLYEMRVSYKIYSA